VFDGLFGQAGNFIPRYSSLLISLTLGSEESHSSEG
jgi:hypothetical protein